MRCPVQRYNSQIVDFNFSSAGLSFLASRQATPFQREVKRSRGVRHCNFSKCRDTDESNTVGSDIERADFGRTRLRESPYCGLAGSNKKSEAISWPCSRSC